MIKHIKLTKDINFSVSQKKTYIYNADGLVLSLSQNKPSVNSNKKGVLTLAKELIIVESPHKAKTISGILGAGYIVKASLGHIRDLEKSEISVNLETMQPKYKILPDKFKLVKELKDYAQKVDRVIIASDPDREGEAIGWHLTQALSLKNYKRAEFHEITEKGVRDGLANLKDLDIKLVSAQEARRVLDRLIGYGISPNLSSHIDRAKSAGRVQTAALNIIVNREREILNFKPEDRFKVELDLKQSSNAFTAVVVRKNGDEKNTLSELKDKAVAEKIVAYLQGKPADIINITHKDIKRNPSAPFTTSTYQQAVNSMLGISSEDAMKIAQKLYEGGYITYMRTDSVRLSDEAVSMAKGYIVSKFGSQFFTNHIYKNKDGSQDAHEAIRPADINQSINGLSEDELKVYNLIFNRFISSQMSPAIYDQTVITVKIGEVIAEANASVMKFKGYKAVYNDEDEEKESILSGINQGSVDISGINIRNWKTKPPARFTEASIIKELEAKGVGRPSTYANIIKTLKLRTYIEIKNKQIIPTSLGTSALDYLIKEFNGLFSVDYTAKMEEKLDEIAQGKMKYKDVVTEIYNNLKNHNIDFANGGFKPSEKQIALAEKLSSEHNLPLPADYKENGRTCKDFIDNAIKSNPLKPSEKQIALAEKLSQEKNIELPDGYLNSMDICSKFIQDQFGTAKNSKSSGKANFTPSDKQVSFVESIAKKKGVKPPKGYKSDYRVCKQFIEENKA